jgi:hypothetical protein
VGRCGLFAGLQAFSYGFAHRWMASDGGAVRLCLGGGAGGRRLLLDTTAHRSESLRTRWGERPAAAYEGHRKSKAGASGGGAPDSKGSTTPRVGGGPSCGRHCPGSLVAAGAVNGISSASRCQADDTYCGAVTCGLTPAVRADWQSPPTATRDPGHQGACEKGLGCHTVLDYCCTDSPTPQAPATPTTPPPACRSWRAGAEHRVAPGTSTP